MRRFMLLLAITGILVTQGGAEPADSGSWAVSEISKSDSHRHAKLETGDTAGPLKYLHLEVKFDLNAAERKLHKFRVVDSKGKPVGDMFGADPKKSLLVFERETPWASLNGLYLEGQGHRVPLFATQPVRPAPTTVVQPAPVPSQTVVEQPRAVYVPPRTDSVVTVPVTPTYVPRTETVVVDGPRDQVVVHHDRVIHDGPDVVVHDDPDVVVHHAEDTTRHVVHHHARGGGHGHGGSGGDGTGAGGGGCPYGDSCPICGTNADDSSLDPWAFDEMGQGRYDDLLARIENSGAALDLNAPGAASGSGSSSPSGPGSGSGGPGAHSGSGVGPAGAPGLGAGAGAGLGIGQGTGPLPGMASTGTSPGSGPGLPGMGPGSGPGAGPGAEAPCDDGSCETGGPGAGPDQGPGQGTGEGQGPGSGAGPGPGEGQGPGPEDGYGPGPEEQFASPAQGAPGQGPGGPGAGPGAMAGPVEGAPAEMMPTEPIPGENPMNANNPMNAMTPNGAGGPGGGGGTLGPNNLVGPNYVNTADPRVRFHNLAPEVELPQVDRPVLDVYGYRPTVPYFDPRFRFDPRMGRLGYGYGAGGGGGGGYGAGGGYADLAKTGLPEMPEVPEMLPEVVLYISAGDDGVEGGKIYQVNDAGRVLGVVKLPYQATGLALHRNDGLIAVTPRDRGKIYRVDDKGILSVVMENNPKLPFPVDVGVAGDSDTILVADSVADVLAATNITGIDPIAYKHFEASQYDQQRMSVAVTRDKHVMYGTDAQNGIYRFNRGKEVQETESLGPILPGSGGVAADPKSLKWAATQSPNEIHLYEGGMAVKTFKLAPGKYIYGQGLLSFAPSGAVVVASRHSDEVDKEVWLTAYETAEGKEGQIQSLFPWNRERMLDFVVGPRMIWEGHSPSTYQSKY